MSTGKAQNRLRSRAAALVACTATVLSATQGAKAATEDNGAWFGVFANGKLPPSLNDPTGSWRLWFDAQLRLGDDASTFSQGVVRAGVVRIDAFRSRWTAQRCGVTGYHQPFCASTWYWPDASTW